MREVNVRGTRYVLLGEADRVLYLSERRYTSTSLR
jgi:hypothetical protein